MNMSADDLATVIGEQFEHPAGPNCGVCKSVQGAVKALSAVDYGKLADAWDEGRASIALDFLNPVGDNGMRQSSTNPYRAGETK